MTPIQLGLVCGLAFGVIDVLIMLPLKFETSRKRTEAMTAAFIERFMIGFLIPVTDLGVPGILKGALIGAGLSIPSAIITRLYPPIIGIGIVGGLVIGWIAG